MTDDYFFDTDCLSAFLWVRGESILSKLYSGHIILPMQVYDEISKVPHLLGRVDEMRNNGDLEVKSIEVGTEGYCSYLQMTASPEEGMRIIGRGEAAAIVMAKESDGILASNNLKDILPYVKKYGLNHITTGDILIKAMEKGMITEDEGNEIWGNMIRKKECFQLLRFLSMLKRLNRKRPSFHRRVYRRESWSFHGNSVIPARQPSSCR